MAEIHIGHQTYISKMDSAIHIGNESYISRMDISFYAERPLTLEMLDIFEKEIDIKVAQINRWGRNYPKKALFLYFGKNSSDHERYI